MTDREAFLTQHPHLSEFMPYLDLLEHESERGKVLISTGFLEEQLKRTLVAFFAAGQGAEDLFDGPSAPLATFAARSAACHALGLVSDREFNDLTLIRRIRNDFAHDIHTSFATPKVIDRCKYLQMKAEDYDSEKLGPIRVDPAGQFLTSAVSLITRLINRPRYVKAEARTTKTWPI